MYVNCLGMITDDENDEMVDSDERGTMECVCFDDDVSLGIRTDIRDIDVAYFLLMGILFTI